MENISYTAISITISCNRHSRFFLELGGYKGRNERENYVESLLPNMAQYDVTT